MQHMDPQTGVFAENRSLQSVADPRNLSLPFKGTSMAIIYAGTLPLYRSEHTNF